MKKIVIFLPRSRIRIEIFAREEKKFLLQRRRRPEMEVDKKAGIINA